MRCCLIVKPVGGSFVSVIRLLGDKKKMTVHIQGSASRHAWGLGGWVANLPLRCYQTNAHNRRNGGNIYNVRNCGISIVISGTENIGIHESTD